MVHASAELATTVTNSLNSKTVSAIESRATRFSQYVTPFVGRTAEIEEIRQLIETPDCRLLTLVGTGGIGKTRLAIQLCEQMQRAGRHVAFVDLQPLDDSNFLLPTLIDTLGLARGSNDEPLKQLARHLSGKQMLLVFDNFEHLFDGAGLISDLILAVPDLKILATSRVVLHLQEEWVYSVGGLYFPDEGVHLEGLSPGNTPPEAFDAVQLFYACARRTRPNFQLEQELTGVLRICRLVEGMPLAIELAAAWAMTMTAESIAAEIQKDLDFLVSPLRNLPARHRSIQVVFQRSWQLLSADEQNVFMQLSVFRGGFEREAAVSVANASLPLLAALVNKSLLRWRANGRYEIHELLRQYAEAALNQSPETMRETRNRHSHYFTTFLGHQLDELTTQQKPALMRTQAELDNIRVAWQWDVAHANLEGIQRAAFPLFAFCQRQSRYVEGIEMLAAGCDALQRLPSSALRACALAELLAARGWLELRLGHLEEAATVLETAHSLYTDWNLTPSPIMGTDPQAALPLLAVIQGDYARAHKLAVAAWEAAAARHDKANLVLAGYSFTSTLIAQGNYQAALDKARVTLELSKADRWFTAYLYNHLGEITQMLGDLQAAHDYYQASFRLRQEFDDPEGMAVALNHLGEIALQQGDFEEACKVYTQSLGIYQGLGDRGGLVKATHGIGMAYRGLGEHKTCCAYLCQALQMAYAARLIPLTLTLMVDVSLWLLEQKRKPWAVAALAFAGAHPAADRMTKDKAQKGLTMQMHPLTGANAYQNGEPTVEELIQGLLNQLESSQTQVAAGARAMHALHDRQDAARYSEQPLIDPLSERELEVLTLIAAGKTNPAIAKTLSITLSTVKAHSNHIYSKLAVSNRVQAVTRARELGLI